MNPQNQSFSKLAVDPISLFGFLPNRAACSNPMKAIIA
jgi:hypothetical protein